MQNSIFEYGLNQIGEAAAKVVSKANEHKIWCFYGEMGAGKTTLIKQIGIELGVIGAINSPSFSLVNEYNTVHGKIIYHFDFYRIKSIEEVYDIGIEDYFGSGNLCLIEWPEMISEILLNETVFTLVLKTKNEVRELILSN